MRVPYGDAVLERPVVRLDSDLPLPEYARPGDAGLDLLAAEATVLASGGGRALVPTGLAVAIPDGHAGFVQPRSGLALKHGVQDAAAVEAIVVEQAGGTAGADPSVGSLTSLGS